MITNQQVVSNYGENVTLPQLAFLFSAMTQKVDFTQLLSSTE